MSLRARITGHADEVTLVRFDGKQFVFESARAFAPGQPMCVNIDAEGSASFDLKSIGSVKRPEGGYFVRARAATMSRGAREFLDRVFGTGA